MHRKSICPRQHFAVTGLFHLGCWLDSLKRLRSRNWALSQTPHEGDQTKGELIDCIATDILDEAVHGCKTRFCLYPQTGSPKLPIPDSYLFEFFGR